MGTKQGLAEAPEASSSRASVMQPGESNSRKQLKAAASSIIKWPSSPFNRHQWQFWSWPID